MDAAGGKGFREGMSIRIRAATYNEVPVLRALIEASVRQLQAHDYTEKQREAALRTVFGVDSQLIADGTYLVADASAIVSASGDAHAKPAIAGCGGWSKRNTLYGGDQHKDIEDPLLDPETDAARIRAFFVHPDFARRGVGTHIINVCENAAKATGFKRLELGATLPGVPLYKAMGYIAIAETVAILTDGVKLEIIRMGKDV